MRENTELRVLNISDILPNRFQPRLKFDQAALEELAESIAKFGVIEPIVVRPVGNKFEIIAGERRYKASKLASKSTIPAIIVNLSDKDSEELALLENVQRQALNPIEEAVSYKRILDAGYITCEALAKKIGKSQAVILNKIKLLSLADEVQSSLLNNKISERHARSLLKLSNLSDQVDMLNRIVNERLTVKQTDREIRKMLDNVNSSKAVDFSFKTENLFNAERGEKNMNIENINNGITNTTPPLDINSAANHVESGQQAFVQPAVSPDVNHAVEEPIIEQLQVPKVEPVVSPVPTNNPQSVNDDLTNNLPFNLNQDAARGQSDLSVPVEPIREPVQNNSQSEISNIVADAFKNAGSQVKEQATLKSESNKFITNIPDINIFQNNSVSGTDINLNNEPATSNIPSTTVSDGASTIASTINQNVKPLSGNVPDFAQVVKMLRDYADQIEKTGRYINVEEVDLGNQYKVIFTLDK